MTPADEERVTCGHCRKEFDILKVGIHLTAEHSDLQAVGGLELWPDGGIVAYEDLTPERFHG